MRRWLEAAAQGDAFITPEQIQKAINKSGNNDRVVVMPGVYTEPTSRSKPTHDPACDQYEITNDRNQAGAVSYAYQFFCPNDQNLIDNFHKGDRRGRSAALNMVITETGAAKAVAKALPELPDGRTYQLWGGNGESLISLGVPAGVEQAIRVALARDPASRGTMVAPQDILGNLMAGIRYIYTQPLVRFLMLLIFFHCALTMAYESAFPLMARTQLGMSAAKDLFEVPAYLIISVGAGAVLGRSGARTSGRRAYSACQRDATRAGGVTAGCDRRLSAGVHDAPPAMRDDFAASVRRGTWLIPAYHSAIDAGIKDAHDDPQNFELERFADELKKLVDSVKK